MKWLRKIFPRIDQYPLSYRTLVYVLLCSSTFALMSTAAQLYLEYRRDVSNLHKSIELIENSYLASIPRTRVQTRRLTRKNLISLWLTEFKTSKIYVCIMQSSGASTAAANFAPPYFK